MDLLPGDGSCWLPNGQDIKPHGCGTSQEHVPLWVEGVPVNVAIRIRTRSALDIKQSSGPRKTTQVLVGLSLIWFRINLSWDHDLRMKNSLERPWFSRLH